MDAHAHFTENPHLEAVGRHAYLADFVMEGEGGGYKSITFQYVPEPAGAEIVLLVGALGLRRRRMPS